VAGRQTGRMSLFASFDENAVPESTNVKTGIDVGDSRRRRMDAAVQIRKNKREEQLRKRRSTVATEGSNAQAIEASAPGAIKSSLENLPAMLAAVQSNNVEDMLKGTIALRKLLSRPVEPPVQQVIDAGFLPVLCEFLKANDKPTLQFEAAWVLTNIGSSDLTESIVTAGALPLLAPLLRSPAANVRDQAAWCIGNIAGDSCQLRDAVLETPGVFEGLLANLDQPENIQMLRNVTWSVSNLCRGSDPRPSLQKLVPVVGLLAKTVMRCGDMETIIDATWALSYLSDGDNESLNVIVSTGICPKLVELLGSSHNKCIPPCLRTLGNIVTGNDAQTQAAIDAGLLEKLVPLLSHPKVNVRKEAAWTASNITAGTKDQISQFLQTHDLPESIVGCLRNAEFSVKREAAWTIANICSAGDDSQMRCIVENFNTLEPLGDLLALDDDRITDVVLTALNNILKHDPEHYTFLFHQCEGLLDHIESLQSHANEAIHAKVDDMLQTYFSIEDEEEDFDMAPQVNQSGNMFAFKADAPDAPQSEQGTFSFGSSETPSSFNFT